MYAVEVRDHVMLAHSIPGEVFGPAQNLHGATYVIDVAFLRDTLSDDGIVVDIGRAHDVLGAALAPLRDPELPPAAALPEAVPIHELLGDLDAESLALRWKQSALSDSWAAPIGWGANGAFEIDLVVDGPHGLVAGTTGSGKSELLRTIVASLGASVGPDRLNFVLVDYKGGSAFDVCADLPHTVGVVTDLDL